MVLGSSWGLNNTLTQVAAQTTQIFMTSAAAWPSNPNMTTGGSPEPGHSCGLWWQHGPWTSKQTWLQRDSGPRNDPGSSQSLYITRALSGSIGHSDGDGRCSGTYVALVATQVLGILKVFGDNRNHRHRHRSLLQQGHWIQTWPLSEAKAQMSPWPQMTSRAPIPDCSSLPSPVHICLFPQAIAIFPSLSHAPSYIGSS